MASTETFPLAVDHTSELPAAIAAGNYNYANPDITAEHFPATRHGEEQLEAVLVHFGRFVSSKDALAELDKLGLRAGELAELLAFGASYPNKQREFPIAALGSTWQYPGGYRYVPYLDHWREERGLDLVWFVRDWRGRCRFLAFRKSL